MYPLSQPTFSDEENRAVEEEIKKLLKMGVIRKTEQQQNQFLSPIFVKEKKDGSHRMILNLKRLNEYVEYQKFKMDTIQTALNLVSQDCYFASIDLRDAYYSVPVHPEYQKYLKFTWKGALYCFQAAPMGLGPIPRMFTKLTKPILAYLHDCGHIITSFIDDSLLIGQSKFELSQNISDTVKLFDSLGFSVHGEKSHFMPTHEIRYLGFMIDSRNDCKAYNGKETKAKDGLY